MFLNELRFGGGTAAAVRACPIPLGAGQASIMCTACVAQSQEVKMHPNFAPSWASTRTRRGLGGIARGKAAMTRTDVQKLYSLAGGRWWDPFRAQWELIWAQRAERLLQFLTQNNFV